LFPLFMPSSLTSFLLSFILLWPNTSNAHLIFQYTSGNVADYSHQDGSSICLWSGLKDLGHAVARHVLS
jgi:hypothetical protein